MKKRWVFWWVANASWIVLFTVGAIFISIREVDGAGVTQTLDAKLAAFLVLLLAFIFPIVIQIVWLIINFIAGNNKDN